jgi:Ca-activated chloride channel homolog
MRFENPLMAVYILWAVPIIVLFWIFTKKHKKAAMNRFIHHSLWHEIIPFFNLRRELIGIILLSLSVLFLLASLTRPQIGFSWRELKREGLDIIFAVDVSRSMLAEDIAPNRLKRAKMAIEDAVTMLRGDRVGLVAFAGEAFLQCPLTLDYDGFRVALMDLDADTIPAGGTNISMAIEESIRSFEKGQIKYRIIILISDGEEHEGSALNAAKQAKDANIKIFCIGMGSPAGAYLPIKDKSGKREFIKDAYGQNVLSRLDEDMLKEIAFTTGGAYIRSLSTDFGLDTIYNEKISMMERREITGKKTKQYNESFQALLIVAIVLLVADMFINKKSL